jgi:hypothetical protein
MALSGIRQIHKAGTYTRVEANGAPAETIFPGAIVMIDANGDMINHNSAGGTMSPIVAIENELLGKGVEEAYIVEDQIEANHYMPGSRFAVRVAAGAPAIAAKESLESAGDGTVRAALPDADTDLTERGSLKLRAVEALDNSASGDAALLLVEAI